MIWRGNLFWLAQRRARRAGFAETPFAPDSLRYTLLVREKLLPALRACQWIGKALFAFPGFAFLRAVKNAELSDALRG